MSGPIFYIALLVVLVSFPAYAGWKLGRKREQSARMAFTILGGQLILTPGMTFIALTGGAQSYSFSTVLVYAAMALVISIMIFAILEMKNWKP